MANPFLKKIAEAKTSQSGNPIKRGRYTLTVLKMMIYDGEGGTFFIIEFRVDEATDVAGDPDTKRNQNTASKAGTTVSYVVNLTTNKSAAGNIKSFVMALLGVEGDDVDPAELQATLEELINEDAKAIRPDGSALPVQPGRGMKIGCETTDKQIKGGKNKGEWFVGMRWTHIPMEGAALAQSRADVDAWEKRQAS